MLMFERPQKSVVRAKFRLTPTPPWFVTRGKIAASAFRQLADLEAQPSLARIPGIAIAALS